MGSFSRQGIEGESENDQDDGNGDDGHLLAFE
jgi:hypothetical protein